MLTGSALLQCVKLGKFDSDRAVTFIPPDGEFVLMKVQCSRKFALVEQFCASACESCNIRLRLSVVA